MNVRPQQLELDFQTGETDHEFLVQKFSVDRSRSRFATYPEEDPSSQIEWLLHRYAFTDPNEAFARWLSKGKSE